MRRFSIIVFACAILGTTSTAYSESLPLPSSLNILGIVTAAARPVEHALVIALNLNTLEAIQTFSGNDGGFSLPLLPAAVYRIIAVKPGFAPTMTMIVPTRKDYRLALKLQDEKRVKKNTNQEIWELRGSLPPYILRELDMAMESPVVMASNDYQIPRLKGEMMSMTGVADQSSNPGFAKTALGVQSRLGVLDYQHALGPEGEDAVANLRADRAAAAGYYDGLAPDECFQSPVIDVHPRTQQQVLHFNWGEPQRFSPLG